MDYATAFANRFQINGARRRFAPTDQLKSFGDTTPQKAQYVVAHDLGSGSISSGAYEAFLRRGKKFIRPVDGDFLQKVSTKCGLGRNAIPNDSSPTVSKEGKDCAINTALPKLLAVHRQFKGYVSAIVGTAWLRDIFEYGSEAAQADASDIVETYANAFHIAPETLTIASKWRETEDSADAAVLAGFTDGIVFMSGNNSCEIMQLRDGKIVDGRWAVIRLGAASIQGRKDIRDIVQHELNDLSWLSDAIQETGQIMLLGGTCRVFSRTAEIEIHDIDPLTTKMPYEGYKYTWGGGTKFEKFLDSHKNATRESLFKDMFGITETAAISAIKKDGYVWMKVAGKKPRKVRKAEFEKLHTKWNKKIGCRAHTFPYAIPLLQTLLNELYRLNDSRKIKATFSPASIREAIAARMVGATAFSYT